GSSPSGHVAEPAREEGGGEVKAQDAGTPPHPLLTLCQTARGWNDLPADAVHHSNPIHFKTAIAYVIH
ncbi:hypothetical protein HPB47_001950, partial [Ixodes persulcatus]